MANPGELDLVDRLLDPDYDRDEPATRAVLRVFRFLCSTCERYFHPGCWPSQKSISKRTGLGESTVRVALDWLESRGWIARSDAEVDGEDREVIWCLWLLPSDSLAGRGRFVVEGGSIPCPAPTPEGAENGREGAESCAPKTAPKNSKRIRTKDHVDDDVGGGSSSFAPRSGGEEGPPTPPVVPTAALDQGVLAFLAAEVEDQDDRAELARAFPDLLGLNLPVSRIFDAIRVAIRRRSVEPVSSLAAYAAGVMRNWLSRDASKSPGPSPAASSAPGVNQPTRAESDARKAERSASDARDRLRRERWEATDPAERAAIDARFEVDRPPFPGERPGMRSLLRDAYRLEAMDAYGPGA